MSPYTAYVSLEAAVLLNLWKAERSGKIYCFSEKSGRFGRNPEVPEVGRLRLRV